MGAEQSQLDREPEATGESAKIPIEIKRIKKKLDLMIQAIERMINIMENDSKFIRFSIVILIIMFAFYLSTLSECKGYSHRIQKTDRA